MDPLTLIAAAWQRFQNAGIIFYWPYLASAFVITVIYLVVACRMSLAATLSLMFSRKVWFTKSTRTDVVLASFYALFLSAPAAALQGYAFYAVFQFLQRHFLEHWVVRWPLSMPPLAEGLLLTFVSMMAIDLATYVVHYAMHKVKWLWNVHAVHHATEHLNLFSTHRQHPLEPFILNLFRGAFAGTSVALFYFFFPQRAQIVTVMGLGAGFFVYMFTVNLHHSHVPVRYPKWLRIFILSPHVHHIHHSKAHRHWDKNFGVVFPWWDMLFHTYCDEEVAPGELAFGLDVDQDPFRHSLWKSVIYPLYAPFVRSSDASKDSAHKNPDQAA